MCEWGPSAKRTTAVPPLFLGPTAEVATAKFTPRPFYSTPPPPPPPPLDVLELLLQANAHLCAGKWPSDFGLHALKP